MSAKVSKRMARMCESAVIANHIPRLKAPITKPGANEPIGRKAPRAGPVRSSANSIGCRVKLRLKMLLLACFGRIPAKWITKKKFKQIITELF